MPSAITALVRSMPAKEPATKPRELSGLGHGAGDDAVHQRDREDDQHQRSHSRRSCSALWRRPSGSSQARIAIAPTSATTTIASQPQAERADADLEVEIEQPQRERRQGERHGEVGDQRDQQRQRTSSRRNAAVVAAEMTVGAMALRQSAATRPGQIGISAPERPDHQRHGDQRCRRQCQRERRPRAAAPAPAASRCASGRASAAGWRAGRPAAARPRRGPGTRCRPATKTAAMRSHVPPSAAERDPAGPLPAHYHRLECAMLLRTLLAVLLLGTVPALRAARAGARLHRRRHGARGSSSLDVVYRCRATPAALVRAGGRAHDALPRATSPGGRDRSGERPGRGALSLRSRRALRAPSNSPSEGIQRGKGVLAPLGAWLLEPRGYQTRPDHRHPRAHAGRAWSSPAACRKVGDAWRLAGATVRFAGYTAIGSSSCTSCRCRRSAACGPRGQARRRRPCCGWRCSTASARATRPAIVDWVKRTAEAEANYWHGFTADQMLVGLVPMPRSGVGFGRTQPGGGVTIMVEVGDDDRPRRLFNDWVLVHELIHSGMPFIRGRGTWFMEGSATYIEPIIRARAGWKTEEEVWQRVGDDMPQGERRVRARPAQAARPRELLGRRDLHAAGRPRHPPRQQRRQGAGGLPRPARCGAGWAARDRVGIDAYAAGLRRARPAPSR